MKQYAPFFEWFENDRKELGVVEELLTSLNETSDLGLHSPQIHKPDPPDCICLNASGGCVAIEVAEVVCEEATRRTAKGERVMRLWNPGEFFNRVGALLAEKDRKTFHGGPYAAIVACLFTDEPMLTLEQARVECGANRFGSYQQLTAAYLLFSYDPRTKSYPVVPLTITT